jgi:anti-sigma regulatory factor (Ser/Thr protein kinase)
MLVTTAPGTGAPHTRSSRTRPAADLPSRAFLDLGAVLTAPGCARAWTREILWEWEAAELADVADSVNRELVTNSVNACAGLDRPEIRLVLTLDQGELTILVRDGHPGGPVAAQPGADDESRRGLLIVESLSDRCGWYPLEGGGRPSKVTWAVIAASWRPGGKPPEGHGPDADTPGGRRPAPVLPVRPRRPPSPVTEARAPRIVDLNILARVKAALERL